MAHILYKNYGFTGTTSTTTPCRLTTDGHAPNSSNVAVLDSNTAEFFNGYMIAHNVNTGAATTFGLLNGVITRGATAASTAIVPGSAVLNQGFATVGAPVAPTLPLPTVSADTVYGGFDIRFTPPAGNTDVWNVTLKLETIIA